MPQRRRVALLIETSRAYGRGVLQGIARYARLHGPWSFYFEQRQTGEKPPAWLRSWSGDGIISRVDDLALARAIRYIRLHATDAIEVTDVVAQGTISRRALERRFTKQLGRTPNEEILRVQLERIKQLLVETDWPLAKIADRAGFLFPEYLNVVFKREFGLTPGEYRRKSLPEQVAEANRRATGK